MKPKTRRWLSLCIGTFVVAGILLFREPLRWWVTERATLANSAPPPELVEAVIKSSPDRKAAILAAWDTGKIIHREAVIGEIADDKSLPQPLPAQLESIVLAGALDADMNIREASLGILRDRNDPGLIPLAIAQIQDCDPQLRLLGLRYLKDVSPAIGVPSVIPLMNDQNPQVVFMMLKLLEKWSGEKFGVKAIDTISFEDGPEGSDVKVKSGVALARNWWNQHQTEFPPVRLELPREALSEHSTLKAGDFSLRDLHGGTVKLSDFHGKVVLINFWTTWCTACVSEMPDLIALQRDHEDKLAILGVSLDFLPDDDGDAAPDVSPETLKARILNTVRMRGINYPVLLDEYNDVGGRFNGGELPTTVIVDGDGNIRRRFIGTRELSVFEAMITEANKPLSMVPTTATAER